MNNGTSLHAGSATNPPDPSDSTYVDESVLARLTGFVESATPPPPISPLEGNIPLAFNGQLPEVEDELGTPEAGQTFIQPQAGVESISTPQVEGAEAAEANEEEISDPRAVKTKTTMANSPLTRLGIVGGGVGVIVLFLMIGWNMLSGGLNEKPAPKPSPTTAVDQSGMPVADASAADLANSKSENALNGQRELLSKINGGKPKPPAQAKGMPKVTPVVTPTPAPPVPVIETATPAPVTVMPTQTQIDDPFTKWQRASMVGSFGKVSVATVTPASAPSTITPPPSSSLFAPTNSPTFKPTSSASGAKSISQLRSGGDGSGLRSTPITPVLVGTSAPAELTTAIIMTSDNTSAVNPDDPNSIKYLAKLNAPIKDSKGADAIPAGSQLVLVATNFSPQSGTMAFQVKSVIVNNTEYALPSGSILVRGKDGALLALNKRGGKSGVNLLGPLFAGVGQAAQLINQPTSSSIVTGGVSTTTTTSSTKPNYLAGFASGVGTSLAQQIQQQTQLTQQQAASNSSVSWQAGTGTQLQVVVNSTFEM